MKFRVTCQTPEEPALVYVIWKNKGQIGICKLCWEKIADKKWECGDSVRPDIKELLSDKARFGENPILTEYKPKEKESKELIENEGEY
jgi:hypothetical protein